jgi:hypothetical protein
LPPDASPRLCYAEAVRLAGTLLVFTRLAFLALLASLASLASFASFASCATTVGGDPPSNQGVPPPGGKDKRIKDVGDPGAEAHKDYLSGPVAISGAIVIAVDKFDETANGKSTGTIYVQDLGSKDPFSGITLFAPTFNPGNLSVGPGDVLDLNGQYTEAATIGSTVAFAPGSVLPQISKPVATFRYETAVPEPVDIDANDLADYTKGRRWMGMLVRVKDITISSDATNDKNGRVAVNITAATGGSTSCSSPFPKPAQMTNDLFDVDGLGLKSGTRLASITGVVGFFCNLHLAPRTPADIVVAK